MDGTLAAARRAHLAGCDRCRDEVAALAATAVEAAEDGAPEPSPLFWEHFSARVSAAVREAPPARRGQAWWGRWPALVPAAAMAVLVAALVATIPAGGPLSEAGPAGDAGVLDAPLIEADATTDAEWRALADLLGPIEWDTAGPAALSLQPGDAERALAGLTDDERRELSALIAGELARLKS
jgi:hypothetical protein